MGITQLSLDRINRHLKPNSKLLIIGCQNLYNAENYMEIAHPYFERLGHTVRSLDILGCNGSETMDLREDLGFEPEWDMVNDSGSKEHIDGDLYQPMLNIHNACKIGGVMVHENPRFAHWPLHGQHFFSMDFYKELGYEVLELCEEAAMGNFDTGMNVCAVLRKNNEKFMSKRTFDKLYKETIFKS